MFSVETLVQQALWVGLVSVLMALMITIIDSIVNNYGEVVVSINGKKDLTVKGGSKLLATLADQGVFLPSACGGRGSCGACKCQVDTDVGPHLPTETPYMTDKELKQNVRLACQVKVKSDIKISIPEELFNIKKLTCKVEKIVDVTYDIKEVTLKMPHGTELSYVSGQYGQFEVPPYGDSKEATARAYSFSSNPQRKDELEFLIRLVPGGIVTTYVHQHLKVGQNINVIVPVGDFHVRDTDAAMICVAGGSGMAPFKSIFNDMIERGTMGTRDVWYFFGARTTRDTYYLDWLWSLDKKYERFHFVPALSEPKPGESWDGPVGLITEVLDKYLQEKIPLDQAKEGYLCGSPGMLDACMNVMRKNKMTEDKIYFDKFA
ncbi:MAG: 2Fe-2S iron-sulfur cluster binding domain-containing protein [Spirochaetales bacterium]|nr:2Fe-2S iron-sulfur cluster binding domain-containing protein [Spirochaetales bacterium]